MDSDTVLAILQRAVNAPSGENCQPWKFTWNEHVKVLHIYNIPERDMSLYNVAQSGTLIAQGTLIENIAIVATTFKYITLAQVEDSKDQANLVATLTFKHEEDIKPDSLHEFIEKRCTNRKMYKPATFDGTRMSELKAAVGSAQVSAEFITDKATIEEVAGSMSMNERIVFEHPLIHHFFFSHIRWTKEEEEEEKNGFYLPTLELDAKQQQAMKLFRKWSIVRLLNHIGVSRMIANDNKKHYASSSLVGALLVDTISKSSLIETGRTFQRIWLTVTKQGLSLQPATGIVLLKLAIEQGASNEFTRGQRDIIDAAHAKFTELFGSDKKKIAVMFRIGDGGEPSAYSQKMQPEVAFI